MYTQEQIFHYLRHTMQRAHVSISTLQRLVQSHAMEMPEPPRRLSLHIVHLEKRRTRLTMELTRTGRLLSVRIALHVCHNDDGRLYTALTSARAPDGAFDNPSSRVLTERMDETLTRLAESIARRITAVDSLMWYFSQFECWIDRAQRGISAHQQHVREQRLRSVSHRRFFSKMCEIESERPSDSSIGVSGGVSHVHE